MSDIDPLIRRELQWMALGVLENRDLSSMVIDRVRRRRRKRITLISLSVIGVLLLVSGTYFSLEAIRGNAQYGTGTTSGSVGSKDRNTLDPTKIIGIVSDYPLTWEQSVGDVGAISKAAGLNDTLSGLTAIGLKVSWEQCNSGQCPTSWMLSLSNKTQDLISASPSLMIFTNNNPLVSSSRPTTVLPGDTVLLVFNFPEFKENLQVTRNASWQWNWFLTSLN
jgi:hypothetical protein